MFDLFRSREKAVRIVLGGLLTIVAVSMVITLIPGFGSNIGSASSDNQVLAEVAGEKLMAQDLRQRFENVTRSSGMAPELMEVYFPQYVHEVIQQKGAMYEAQKMGLTVTDDDLMGILATQFPQYFQNGALVAKDQFEAALAQQGQTPETVLDELRGMLLMKKLQNAIFSGVVVTPKEVEDEFAKKYEKAKVQYIAFAPGKFGEQMKPSDDELRAIFNSNKADYPIPEKYSFQVVVIDQAKVEAGIQVSDAQLRQAYSASMDNFRMPEQIHARHILISTEGKSDSEKKTLKAKAEDLEKQLKNGADFAALAQANSDDTGSKVKGGDLGTYARGQFVPEFERVAYALKPKEISGVVTTQFGYHIIQLLEKTPAFVKPFDEVKAALATELKKQGLSDKMQQLGDQVEAALKKSPGTADEIAKRFGVDLVTVSKAGASDAVPTLGSSPEIASVLPTMKPNDVSAPIPLPANRFAVVVLKDKSPARTADFAEVATLVKERYLMGKSQAVATEKATEAADRIRKGEDMTKVAKSMNLEVVTSSDFGRNDSVEGLGQSVYLVDAFTKPVGTVLGPILINGRNIVAKVMGHTEPDKSAFLAERDAIVTNLKQQKAQTRIALMMDGIEADLVVDGKIKMHNDAIQRAVASYRK